MALWIIGDLHLSFSTDKPMDIFHDGWKNHPEKIKMNWLERVKADDVVILAGDTSWGMTLDEALADFKFIDGLCGKKLIIKGNHDYWWQTVTKMRKFFDNNDIKTIDFIYNNCFIYKDIAICGTRGWMLGEEKVSNQLKILEREAGRLERSLASAPKEIEKIAVLHYPVILKDGEPNLLVNVLKKYSVKHCFYGQLHAQSIKNAFCGEKFGINFKLVSADSIDFCVLNILQY